MSLPTLLQSHPCGGMPLFCLPAAFGTADILLMLLDWILYLCQPQKTNVTCHSNNADVTLLLLLPAKEAISTLPT